MTMIETSSTTPPSPIFAGSERQQQQAAPPPSDSAPAAPVPEAAPRVAETAPSSFGFALHYDQGMQRMILEARDPVTGFVIFQMPTKYVTKQFSAGAGALVERARGGKVDSAV